jgi:hypothetical protein
MTNNFHQDDSFFRPSSKLRDRHLNRLAVVYVRQSSPHQVAENRESRERQYALAERPRGGWRVMRGGTTARAFSACSLR